MLVAWRGPEGRDQLTSGSNSRNIYSLDGISLRHSKPRAIAQQPARSVILGNFRYGPNHSGLRSLITLRCRPHSLTVVGDVPKAMKERLQRADIETTGVVSDVGPWIATAAVGIDPVIVGSGISTKVLTYASYGTPVVCTKFATRGVHPTVSTMFQIVDDVHDIPSAVNDIRGSYEKWIHGAEAARVKLRIHHDIEDEIDLIATALVAADK
ncbi:glycosyltransferase family 4 protein [Mycolicibacterium frederiksbergense]|uniref:glycosyltransferase family 4 protein n=1 Tax=Mycolicibacterium frederiksbergense TaxID=117567 RepID=UPI00265C1BC0|nr:glycosyltransferase family 4 protein [Mycolicibacterium frederiksbergense]MDO0978134.1 glycosyltransferase family 4 protein [Mycolicibacterium frederiksbergense]